MSEIIALMAGGSLLVIGMALMRGGILLLIDGAERMIDD